MNTHDLYLFLLEHNLKKLCNLKLRFFVQALSKGLYEDKRSEIRKYFSRLPLLFNGNLSMHGGRKFCTGR